MSYEFGAISRCSKHTVNVSIKIWGFKNNNICRYHVCRSVVDTQSSSKVRQLNLYNLGHALIYTVQSIACHYLQCMSQYNTPCIFICRRNSQ